ncbi:hypothetical protein LEMLEM_LOCUS4837 [Lemmus lemmus]
MIRLSHSGSSGCGSGCGSSMVREPRRRALSDGRASSRGPRQRPARPPLAREASRRRRRGATAPLPTAAVPCHGT